MNDCYLAEIKKTDDARQGWDVLDIKRTLPAAQLYRPISEGGCQDLDPK
jgi:branched-chain amino acid transport system substrate-binding protein